jgi:hypothetical protein
MEKKQDSFRILKVLIEKALKDYFTFDHEDLYRNGINEPTLSHRIALYIEHNLKGYEAFRHLSVDCEYNKMGNILKGEKKGEIFRPDITVHQRGTNVNNLCYIEIKKCSIKKNAISFTKMAQKDFKKIKKAMKSKLQYKTACFISILKSRIQFYFLTKSVTSLDDIQEIIEVCPNQ